MSNTPLPFETQEQIYELGQKKPRLSNRDIGRMLGVDHTVAMKYRKAKPEPKAAKPTAANVSESHEHAGDTWDIELRKTRICTLEQLIEHCEIDLDKWEVVNFKVNKWEMGYTTGVANNKIGLQIPLFQVKALLRKRRFATENEYVEENTRLRRLNARMESSLRTEKQMAKRLAVNHAGHDDLLDNMSRLVESLGDIHLPSSRVAAPPQRIRPALNDGHTEDAVLLISDTHYGDKIRREDTSGFSEFDSVIAGNRTGYIFRAAKEVLSIQRAAYPIKKLHVWFGGDIGNGELHDSAKSNDLIITEQIHFAYHMLKFGIEDLLTLTVPDKKGIRIIEKIVLLFTVGNHMRMDEKMPYKVQARRTFDWLIYQMLIERFKDNPLVEIRTEMSPFIFETIRGHRHLFCHGNQVGYKNSPSGQVKAVDRLMTLARALFDSPVWRKTNGLVGETFSRVCIGDIHVPLTFPRFKSNASLNGQNELGVNWQLEPIPAGQQIFGVTEKHQETWSYFLDCTAVQKTSEDMNSYGEFAAEYMERAGR